MKRREDFVTNSSSSSFLIAIHKECKLENIIQALQSAKKEILKFIVENQEYFDLDPEAECILKKTDEKEKEEKMIRYLAERIQDISDMNPGCKMRLDDWYVFAGKCTNETDDILKLVLYEFSYLFTDNDHFKIQ